MTIRRRTLLVALAATLPVALLGKLLPERARDAVGRWWKRGISAAGGRASELGRRARLTSADAGPGHRSGPRLVPLEVERIGPADDLAG
jgi:hypothetical protein